MIQLLAAATPGGETAASYLDSLDAARVMDALYGAVDCGYAAQLHQRLASARPFVRAALLAVDLARTPSISATHPTLQLAGAAFDQISRDQQLQILSFLLRQRGVSIHATTLAEGVIAMRDGADQDNDEASKQPLPTGAGRGAADPASSDDPDATAMGSTVGASVAAATAPAPIEPLPWAPPGKQPGGWYVGTEAHNAIAASYVAAHVGDPVFTNNTPLSSIFDVFERLKLGTADRESLSAEDLTRRPDISNLRRKHIFEIKPEAAQPEAAVKVRMYLRLFERAGLEMSLGPMGEPGTSGALPAPAGVYIFSTPEPGVITYRYRRGRLVPVPVPQPQRAAERRWKWELQPLTPAQKQAVVTTTFGGAILFMLMLALSAVTA